MTDIKQLAKNLRRYKRRKLIERLREAAAQRVASTAMIGAEDLSAAADALESLEADRDSWERQAGDRLDDVLRVVAERDTLAAELKALREQDPVAWGDEPWMASFGVRVGRDSSNSIDLIFTTVGQRKFQLYAHEAAYLRGLLNKAEIPGYPNTHPVPSRELTDEEILNALDGKVGTQFLTTPVTCKEFWLTAGSVDVRELVRAIEAAIKGEGK